MHYAYLIRSIANPNKPYIGNTVDLKQRLATHDSGGSINTIPHKPWMLIMFLGFGDKLKAEVYYI